MSRNAAFGRTPHLFRQTQIERAIKAMMNRVAGTTEPAIAATCERRVDSDAVDVVAVVALALREEIDPLDCVLTLREGIYAVDDWTVM